MNGANDFLRQKHCQGVIDMELKLHEVITRQLLRTGCDPLSRIHTFSNGYALLVALNSSVFEHVVCIVHHRLQVVDVLARLCNDYGYLISMTRSVAVKDNKHIRIYPWSTDPDTLKGMHIDDAFYCTEMLEFY